MPTNNIIALDHFFSLTKKLISLADINAI